MQYDPTIPPAARSPRRRWGARNTIAAVAVASAGLAGGAILGSTMTAGAATTSSTASSAAASTSAPASSGSAVATAPSSGSSGQAPGGYRVPDLSGTVTAVSASSVTINTSSATTTYAVTSSSDIDKNGEANLSDLKVGDAVTFSTEPSASTPTIDKLHAGNESLDRPTGPPSGGDGGAAPASQSTTAG